MCEPTGNGPALQHGGAPAIAAAVLRANERREENHKREIYFNKFELKAIYMNKCVH